MNPDIRLTHIEKCLCCDKFFYFFVVIQGGSKDDEEEVAVTTIIVGSKLSGRQKLERMLKDEIVDEGRYRNFLSMLLASNLAEDGEDDGQLKLAIAKHLVREGVRAQMIKGVEMAMFLGTQKVS